MGVCIASAGWFSAATSLRVLSKDLPLDAALFGILGMQAGAVASAYLFAWAFRRRVYWFLVYVLTSAVILSLSYTGTVGFREPSPETGGDVQTTGIARGVSHGQE